MLNLSNFIIAKFGTFKREELGLALTEYVVLLGLLTGAVILAVTLYGANLAGIWDLWADWVGGLTDPNGATGASNVPE